MLTLQVHYNTNNKPVLVFTGTGTYASFKVYAKTGSVPVIGTDVPIATGISASANHYEVQATLTAGIVYFVIAGFTAGGVLVEQSSADFYVNETGFTFTSELKACIFTKLLNATNVTAIVGTGTAAQIYDNYPRSLTTYPSVIYYLADSNNPNNDKQDIENISLRVRIYSQSGAILDALKDRVIEALCYYSYEGKEAALNNVIKQSESATTFEGDDLTIYRDILFNMMTERKTLSRVNN